MQQVRTNRLYASMSRRRALAVSGAGAAGMLAAALIGCSSGKQPASPASPVNQAAAPGGAAAAETPKRGGTLRFPQDQNPDSLNPYLAGAGVTTSMLHESTYSQLFQFEPGFRQAASGKVVGDLVDKWEQPDPLTIIAHLNPKAKFDQKAPLNGRALTSDDVAQSWKRLLAAPTLAPNLAFAANPDRPIKTMVAIDASTVRIELAFVDATTLTNLAARRMFIVPAEGVSGTIDLQREMRGSGAFRLDSYQPGVGLKFSRNPDWYGGPERPYVDNIDVPLIADQAQREVQFRARKLHWSGASPTNIPLLAKELPGTEIGLGAVPTSAPNLSMSFAPSQPWFDVRVRRGVSMGIDRDTLADVLWNARSYDALGVHLNVYHNAPLSGGTGAFWLDPNSPKFGPSAAFVKHNVSEAVKLLAAAGYTSAKPLEFDMVYPGVALGQEWPTRVETVQAMLRSVGVKANAVSVDYATEYIPKFYRGKTIFKGKNVDAAVHYVSGGSPADGLGYYLTYYLPAASATVTGTSFPEMEAMVRKERGVIEFDARVAGVHNLNRYATDNMFVIPVGPYTESYDLIWKQLRGPQEWQSTGSARLGVSGNLFPYYWFREQI